MKLRLKIKLVLAITAMVTALVCVFCYVYISQMVRTRINECYADSDFIAHEVFNATRKVLEVDLSGVPVGQAEPEQLRTFIRESLGADPGLKTLLQSIVGYSPIVYDVSIVDTSGIALLHTNPAQQGEPVLDRALFTTVRDGDFRLQLRMIYGKPKIYEVRLPLERDGEPFGSIRVSLSTTLLNAELQPQLDRALYFSAAAIVFSLILAALLSNFALRPLEAISQRLDLMTAGEIEPAQETARVRTDEYGVVTTKIDRLGRQMRDVQEVFSALKENLDQIMANLQDGLMLFTRDSRVVLVSASAEQFVGRPRREILGSRVEEIFSAGSELGRAVLEAFARRVTLAQFEADAGNGRRVELSLDFIEEGGESIGALLTMRDVESVRRIEDEIELSRRLAAIGRLTSGVAHEVKNPINAIVVHLEVLREKLQQLDPATRRHMDIIGNEISRLDRVVQTLVDFTRPVELRLTDIDVRHLVDDVVLLSSPDASGQGVEIVLNLPQEPLLVRVDADLVKQALLNVVLNGVQAMPGSGTLTITARRDDGSAEVAVRDQGPGIPPNLQDKVFNLYFTTKKNGSGIGLAMTYRVVQLHNGSVDFDSRPGEGTTFRLRFPLLESRPEAVPGKVLRT